MQTIVPFITRAWLSRGWYKSRDKGVVYTSIRCYYGWEMPNALKDTCSLWKCNVLQLMSSTAPLEKQELQWNNWLKAMAFSMV